MSEHYRFWQGIIYKSLITTFGLLVGMFAKSRVINYLLPESIVFTCARILFLVSLLFVALLDPFDPYSPLNFYFLFILFVYFL